jgi:predicted phosphate transport protein (TIGR00153 family)
MAVQSPFSKLFGKSPISPIQDHIGVAHRCVSELTHFVEAVIDNDWETADLKAQEVFRLEDEADELKRHIRMNLPKSLFLPMPRSDLLEMLRKQDKLANLAKDIAGLMLGRRMEIPEQISTEVLAYLRCSEEAAEQAVKTLGLLDELIGTGFGGREVHLIQDLVKELDRLEHATDIMQVDVRAGLFSLEDTLKPVNVMFLYKIIEWIGEIADNSQVVGNRMLYLIAK